MSQVVASVPIKYSLSASRANSAPVLGPEMTFNTKRVDSVKSTPKGGSISTSSKIVCCGRAVSAVLQRVLQKKKLPQAQ